MNHEDEEKTPAAGKELKPPCLASLFRDYLPRVRNICRRYLGDAQDAEDVAQEVLLKAHAKWDGFAGRASAATWMHRIAVNECRNFHRHRQCEARVRARYHEDAAGRAAQEYEEMEWEFTFSSLLAMMDEPLRHIAVLYCRDGLTQNQIAKKIGLSRAAVAKRFMVLRKKLKNSGEKMGKALPDLFPERWLPEPQLQSAET